MARPVRTEYKESCYHVMARGNQGQAIFADELDRKEWLETLAHPPRKEPTPSQCPFLPLRTW